MPEITVTLSAVEIDTLAALGETVEAGLHVVLEPLVLKASDTRLQALANAYRTLTPDLQLEATELLRAWAAKKQLPQVERV